MFWPPVKAWTSKFNIYGQRHFVAINYGGQHFDRWVILMSVLDSDVVVKVLWTQLADTSNWKSGWEEKKNSNCFKLNNKSEIRKTNSKHPSADSGLTIPITKQTIRPWF